MLIHFLYIVYLLTHVTVRSLKKNVNIEMEINKASWNEKTYLALSLSSFLFPIHVYM